MEACNQIFVAWDEEWDRVSSILREKKKRDAPKLNIRANHVHMNLKKRLDRIREFVQLSCLRREQPCMAFAVFVVRTTHCEL